MNKTKRLALILVSCVLVIAAVVGVSFAVWSNLEKDHVFTLKSGTLELNISSSDVVNSATPISFDNPVTMSFKVKVEGEKSTLRFAVNSFQYSLVEGEYLPLSPDLFDVELPKTMYGVGGQEEPEIVTCKIKVSLSNAYDYGSFDPVLMGKKFRFNINVKAETYTDPVMYDIIYNNVDGATHDNITQWSVETNHEFRDAVKNGYTFDGWYTDPLLTPESRITELTQDDPNINTLNVYAKWIPVKYTITYYFGSGHQPDNIPEEYTIEDHIDFNSYKPLNDNSTLLFGGYYLDAEFTRPITEIKPGTTENIEIHAKWVQQYNITYIDRLSVENTNPIVFSALDNDIILSDLTADGYVFDGWYISESKVTTINTLTESDIELTAKWIAITYNITWEPNGGKLADGTPTEYTIESEDIDLSAYTPTKNGYDFGGWFADINLNTPATTITKGSTEAKEFYAKWTATPYSINWHKNGGAFTEAPPTEYTIESDDIDPSAYIPTRVGYEFGGWFTDIELYTQATIITNGSTEAKEFYAKWTANTYNIEWKYSGGEEITDIITEYTYDTAVSIESYVPVRNGYTFAGWYLGENTITEIPVGTINDITIVAKWTATPQSITWYPNGGTLIDAPESYTIESEDIDPSTYIPTRKGYEFDGWFTGNDFITSASIITNGSTGARTFYAKWNIITYTLDWELNGGTSTQELPATYDITYSDNIITLVNTIISKNGFDFLGWYDNEAFLGEPITKIGAGTVGNYKLFAKWNIVQYTINYVSDYGDASMLPETYTVNSTIDLTLYTLMPYPNSSNYRFAGYYADEAYSQPITTIGGDGQTGNIDIYVKWLEVYTITWNLDSGVMEGVTQPTEYTAEDEEIDLTVYQPTKEGFNFLGWHNGTTTVTSIPKGSTGNITLTAQWEEIIVPA